MVLCSVPSAYAQTIISALLEKHLIACGTVVEGTSWFYWMGTVEEQKEALIIMKSRYDKWEAIRQTIVQIHPYDIPEIIALPIVTGLAEYLTWINEAVEYSL